MSTKDRFRQAILTKDSSNLKEVWIESCTKVKKTDTYHLTLRTYGELSFEDVLAVQELLGGTFGPLSSGYEGSCSCCGSGSSHIEFEIVGATLPT